MIAVRGAVLVFVAAAVAVAIGFLIGYPGQLAAATAIAVAGLVALALIRDLSARADLRAAPVRPATEPAPPLQLRQVAEALAAAQGSEHGADRRLRPLVRPIAAMRLARRGVDLDRHPDEARALLGEQLWELVRIDRAPGSSLVARGMSAHELELVIERLERI